MLTTQKLTPTVDALRRKLWVVGELVSSCGASSLECGGGRIEVQRDAASVGWKGGPTLEDPGN